MSLSPTLDSPLSDNAEYLRNWDVLGLLSKRGSSFSGRERNCVFLNTGDRRFADVSAVTQLDFQDDGRAVGLTDWDHDGDMDMWLANRTAPRLRLIRNDLANASRHLALHLVGRTCNRDAIGARVEVYLDGPESAPPDGHLAGRRRISGTSVQMASLRCRSGRANQTGQSPLARRSWLGGVRRA